MATWTNISKVGSVDWLFESVAGANQQVIDRGEVLRNLQAEETEFRVTGADTDEPPPLELFNTSTGDITTVYGAEISATSSVSGGIIGTFYGIEHFFCFSGIPPQRFCTDHGLFCRSDLLYDSRMHMMRYSDDHQVHLWMFNQFID